MSSTGNPDYPVRNIRRKVLKGVVTVILGTLLLLQMTMERGYSQAFRNKPVRIMFYNVENLFDVYDDPHKDDNEFLPSGVMRWNLTRYNKKINSLYKTIVAAGEWTPPPVVAFCEVENQEST